jgi:hypothetical protein
LGPFSVHNDRVYAPKGLSREGRAAWRDGCTALEVAGIDPALTIGALERYARAAARLATVEAAWAGLGSPVTATGSTGQLVAHPLLKEMRDETRAVSELAKALLPAQAAGWRRGQPRSPDRQYRPSRRRAEVVPLLPPAVREALGDR